MQPNRGDSQRTMAEVLAVLVLVLSTGASSSGCYHVDWFEPPPCPVGFFRPDGAARRACESYTVCAAGFYVSDPGTGIRDRVCSPCADGTTTVAGADPSVCLPSTECLAGRYVAASPRSSTGTACIVCPFGTFSVEASQAQCEPRTTCAAGMRVFADGYADEDRTCIACVEGTYSEGIDSRSCAPQLRCSAGTYVLDVGTTSTEQRCAGCPTGSFSPDEDASACFTWTACPPGTYVASAGSEHEDRACTPCAAGTETTGANQSACVPVGACPPGTAPGEAACGECTVGEHCAGGVSPAIVCGGVGDSATWDHDGDPTTACATQTHCVAGQYVEAMGTASADRRCAACPTGTFSAAVDATVCTEHSACPVGAREAVPGSATRDPMCEPTDVVVEFGSSAWDSAEALAIDGSGSTFLGGGTEGTLAGIDGSVAFGAFVRKYDRTNVELWTRQIGSRREDRVCGLATDWAGGVVAGGFTKSNLGTAPVAPSGTSAFVRRFDAFGHEAWTIQFGAGSSTVVYSVVVDGNDAIYVAGYTDGTLGGQASAGARDAFIRKLDRMGGEIWTRQFGTSDSDTNRGLAVDASGNVWAVGQRYLLVADPSNPDRWDGYVRKLDSDGNLLWERAVDAAGESEAMAVGIDASGHAYVAGDTSVALPGQTHFGALDGFVTRYDSEGNELFTRQFGGAGHEWVASLAVDVDGGVVIAATSYVGPGPSMGVVEFDALLIAYDELGTEVWRRFVGTSAGDFPAAITIDALGGVVLTGVTDGVFDLQTNAGARDGFLLRFAP